MKVCSVCNEIVSPDQTCVRSSCPNRKSVRTSGASTTTVLGFTGNADRIVQSGLDKAGEVARDSTRRAAFALAAVILAVSAIGFLVFTNWSSPSDSAMVTTTVSGEANVRNAPSAEGSVVLDTLSVGTQLNGRWVSGSTKSSERWFEFEFNGQKGYVWGNNLRGNLNPAPQQTETPRIAQQVWACDYGDPRGPYNVILTATSYEFAPYNPDDGALKGTLKVLNEESRNGTIVTDLEFVGSAAPYGRWGFVQDPGRRKALLTYFVESSGDAAECTPPGETPQYVFN